MKCQYSFEEINNFYEGNISTGTYNEIERHLESCEECKTYYSTLVLTGRCLKRDETLGINMYERIENKIDKNRYKGRKKWVYKFSGKLAIHVKAMASVAAILIVCLFAMFAISHRDQIGSFTGALFEKKDTMLQENVTKDGVLEKIKINGGIELKLLIKGKGVNLNEDLIKQTINTLKMRFEALGFTENEINYNNGIIDIRAPWLSLKKDIDVEKNIREIIKTGEVAFQEADENKRDDRGRFLPSGEVIINNNDIDKAEIQYDEINSNLILNIKLKDEGTRQFSEATGRLVGKRIAVFVDNEFISAPMVVLQIKDGNIMLSNNWNEMEAKILAAKFGSKKLEADIEMLEFREIPGES